MTILHNEQYRAQIQPKLKLTLQFIDIQHKTLLPRTLLYKWIKTALFNHAEITLRFVDLIEGQSLNHRYRGKNYATNVLTFSYSELTQNCSIKSYQRKQNISNTVRKYNAAGAVLSKSYDSEAENEFLNADIILCPAIIEQEAQTQGKTLLAHYAHLVIHGVLHAQGYDHENEHDAQQMESLEITLLEKLNFANPYCNL